MNDAANNPGEKVKSPNAQPANEQDGLLANKDRQEPSKPLKGVGENPNLGTRGYDSKNP